MILIRKLPLTKVRTTDKVCWQSIPKVYIIFESNGPESSMNCLWPAMSSMEQRCMGAFDHVFDTMLCLAILMMGVDTTEGKSLVGCRDQGMEGNRVEQAIVGMVVPDGDRMGEG